MRRLMTCILVAVLACAMADGTAIGPSSVSRTASGSVTISKVISAARTRILNFGHFKNTGGGDCTPSTITLDARTGLRSTTGSAVLAGGTAGSGAYTISGSANSIYGVSFPAVALSSPHTLTVSAFRFYSATNNSTTMGRIGPGGTNTPHVGATIFVPCSFDTHNINEVVASFTLTVTYP